MSLPKVVVVILNTNRKDDTLSCLSSLDNLSYPNFHLIALDNASSDGSVEAIREQFPKVQIVQLEHNLGYAGNNNIGIELAIEQGADWVFILNEDTIVSPDCLDHLVKPAQKNARVGVLGPTVFYFDEPQIIQSAGVKLDKVWNSVHLGVNEKDNDRSDSPREVELISGCALLVKRQLIEQVGKIDERFFYYWEETDWCMRAREAGWLILHVPEAKIWHKGVQRDYHPSPNITYYHTRNRLLFLFKHHAPVYVWLYTILRSFLTLISWTFRPKWHDMQEHRNAMLQGIKDFLRRRWGMRSS